MKRNTKADAHREGRAAPAAAGDITLFKCTLLGQQTMEAKTKKQVRCDDALKLIIAEGRAVFFTLTTPDEVEYAAIRERWRAFRHWFMRRVGNPLYVMNYEKHPGYLQKEVIGRDGFPEIIRSDGRSHGWHIHGVIAQWVPIELFNQNKARFGFGRCDFRRVKTAGVADYLTKHALKAYRGMSKRERERREIGRMRLVNASRRLPPLSSYKWQSELLTRTSSIIRDYRRDYDEQTERIPKDENGLPVPVLPWLRIIRHAQLLALAGFNRWLSVGAMLEALGEDRKLRQLRKISEQSERK